MIVFFFGFKGHKFIIQSTEKLCFNAFSNWIRTTLTDTFGSEYGTSIFNVIDKPKLYKLYCS